MRFTIEQSDFLKKELGLSAEPNKDVPISKKEWDNIQDKAFLIEADEANPDGRLNGRCRVAVEIGNMRYGK